LSDIISNFHSVAISVTVNVHRTVYYVTYRLIIYNAAKFHISASKDSLISAMKPKSISCTFHKTRKQNIAYFLRSGAIQHFRVLISLSPQRSS